MIFLRARRSRSPASPARPDSRRRRRTSSERDARIADRRVRGIVFPGRSSPLARPTCSMLAPADPSPIRRGLKPSSLANTRTPSGRSGRASADAQERGVADETEDVSDPAWALRSGAVRVGCGRRRDQRAPPAIAGTIEISSPSFTGVRENCREADVVAVHVDGSPKATDFAASRRRSALSSPGVGSRDPRTKSGDCCAARRDRLGGRR